MGINLQRAIDSYLHLDTFLGFPWSCKDCTLLLHFYDLQPETISKFIVKIVRDSSWMTFIMLFNIKSDCLIEIRLQVPLQLWFQFEINWSKKILTLQYLAHFRHSHRPLAEQHLLLMLYRLQCTHHIYRRCFQHTFAEKELRQVDLATFQKKELRYMLRFLIFFLSIRLRPSQYW